MGSPPRCWRGFFAGPAIVAAVRLALVAATSMLLLVSACGHKPPYKIGGQPDADALLTSTAPQLDAVTVPDATITLNRVVRADLAMLAQSPTRFRASVSKAGNELVSLAFSEEGYGLRYKLDQIPTGFYSGPADPCAVEAMLGVPLAYEGLVALVLGGAPVLDPPYEITEQKWDRKGGFERLVIANDAFIQEMQFDWVDGRWLFSGSEMWEASNGQKGRWMWALEHDRHTTVGTAVLPGRTKVRAPGKRRDTLVVINYRDRQTDPAWAKPAIADPDTGDTGSPETGGDEGGWEDDGGWEDEGGWENDATPAGEGEAPATEGEAPEPDAPSPPSVARRELGSVVSIAGTKTAAAPATATTPVPAVFRLEASGLTERGDLCR